MKQTSTNPNTSPPVTWPPHTALTVRPAPLGGSGGTTAAPPAPWSWGTPGGRVSTQSRSGAHRGHSGTLRQGCGVGVEGGVGRRQPFWPESELELVTFCCFQLRYPVANIVLSVHDNLGRIIIHSPENIRIYRAMPYAFKVKVSKLK